MENNTDHDTCMYTHSHQQPDIVLTLALTVSRYFPHLMSENMDKKVLFPKIVAILLMIFGSAVLFI